MVFLRHGYELASMDEIAAAASVSKQTVYKHFGSKQQLLTETVLSIVGRVDELVTDLTRMFEAVRNVDQDMPPIVHRHIAAVIQPPVIQLRRLVLAEAVRFPELAMTYYRRAPERVIDTLAAGLGQLAARGLLHVEDPGQAANHLAYLVLGTAIDKALFDPGYAERVTRAELEREADEGLRVFLAAYNGEVEGSAALV